MTDASEVYVAWLNAGNHEPRSDHDAFCAGYRAGVAASPDATNERIILLLDQAAEQRREFKAYREMATATENRLKAIIEEQQAALRESEALIGQLKAKVDWYEEGIVGILDGNMNTQRIRKALTDLWADTTTDEWKEAHGDATV